MQLSAELTLYPLKDQYLPIIEATIEKLNSFDNISVRTFPTATILVGNYDDVMACIDDTMHWCYEEFGKCIFIAKFIPGYEAK